MAAERCPLCQSRLKNGECESCGYKLPDEGDISALYNYDPSDYPQEQPAVREITPEHQMEEIYPNRPEPIEFKVRNDEGKTVGGAQNSPYYQNNGQYGGQNRQNGQPYQTYYRNNGQYGQYRQNGQYGGQNNQPYQPYYRNNGQYGQYRQTGQYGGQNRQNGQPYQPYYRNNGQYPYQPYQGGYQYNGGNSQGSGDLKDFLARFWWLLLISFLFPIPGIIIYAILKKTNLAGIDPKYHKIIFTAIILGFILPP